MAQHRVLGSLAKRSVPEANVSGTARDGAALHWVVGVLSLAGFAALVPFWAPLVLASWGAIIAWPLQQRLVKSTRRRSVAAGLLTAGLVLAILAPVAIVTLSLTGAAVSLSHGLAASKSGTEALKTLSSSAGGGFDLQHLNLQRAVEIVRSHGAGALGAARVLFGAVSVAAVGLVVFVAGFFTFLVEGRQAHDWLMERSPLSHAHFHRLANVFAEVGRGLLIGVGLTALAQGVVATIGYVVAGVPQALVLGLVTMIASLIPSVGSGLVWVPVTAGLALSGRAGAAITLLCIGIVVSLVDNLLRPAFARYAELRLNGLVLFVAMLGGIVLVGAWGLLLGPLVVRLASEGLTILRDERAERASQS
jgi:predicted PurR-regulated permease PerM